MLPSLLTRRHSTLSLLAISAGLSATAYFYGQYSSFSRNALAINSATKSSQAETPTLKTLSSRSVPATVATFDEQWARWRREPRTLASDHVIGAALEELARRDPARAMACALAEPNFQLRESFRRAVLRGWVTAAPDDATRWTLSLPNAERRTAVEALLSSAAARPEDARRVVATLRAAAPDDAKDYEQMLVSAFATAGSYETAAQFAAECTTDNRAACLNAAFYQWSVRQPNQALAALANVTDEEAKSAAFLGLVSGWAEADPAALATYALGLPPGSNRAQAFAEALPQWLGRDSLAASEWMAQHLDPSPDLDQVVTAAATLPSLIGSRPAIAIMWAETIADPELRAATLKELATSWAELDAVSLRRFISTPGLPADEREWLSHGVPTGG